MSNLWSDLKGRYGDSVHGLADLVVYLDEGEATFSLIPPRTNPVFVLGSQAKNIYVGESPAVMQDFLLAKSQMRDELDRLREEYNRSFSEAKRELPRVTAQIKQTLKRIDNISSADPLQKDIWLGKAQEDLDKFHKRLREYTDMLQTKGPKKPDPSFGLNLYFGVDVICLPLAKITAAVGIEARRLIADLGVLPQKPSVIEVVSMVEMRVDWT